MRDVHCWGAVAGSLRIGTSVLVLWWATCCAAEQPGIYLQSGIDAHESVVLSNVPATEDYDLLLAEPRELDRGSTSDMQSGGKSGVRRIDAAPQAAVRYAEVINETARSLGLEPELLHAVIATESGYNSNARSRQGAMGIMQLMPATAQRYGVSDPFDARQNILGGASYLADLLRLFNQDITLTLAAYNAGEGAVLRYGGRVPPFRETQAYVPRVLSNYRRYAKNSM